MAALMIHGQVPLIVPTPIPLTFPPTAFITSYTQAASSAAIPTPLVKITKTDVDTVGPISAISESRCSSRWTAVDVKSYISRVLNTLWSIINLQFPWQADTENFTIAHLRVPYDASYNFTQATLPALSGSDEELRHIPDYILEYAPYVYLYSEEEYWPGLMEEHLEHTTPHVNYEPVEDKYLNPNLDNLDQLDKLGKMYLQSNDDPESYPRWLGGEDNIPDDVVPHRSPAPAVLVVVDKGEYLDAFWFFFYSFNLGNQVLGVRFGNHVGDWEHTAIRFEKSSGKPIEVFYSEHEWGSAYKWEDAEKYDDKRMFTYSAFGTHAMYHHSGVQRYVLPFGLLQDITDQGPIWDPILNMYSYTYDPKSDTVRASDLTPDVPEAWFHFSGHWGDKAYPMDDPRQYRFAGELHYGSGPTGPKFKDLDRTSICQNADTCLRHDDLTRHEMPVVFTARQLEKIEEAKKKSGL